MGMWGYGPFDGDGPSDEMHVVVETLVDRIDTLLLTDSVDDALPLIAVLAGWEIEGVQTLTWAENGAPTIISAPHQIYTGLDDKMNKLRAWRKTIAEHDYSGWVASPAARQQVALATIDRLIAHLEVVEKRAKRREAERTAPVVGQVNAAGGRVYSAGGDQTGVINMGDTIRN